MRSVESQMNVRVPFTGFEQQHYMGYPTPDDTMFRNLLAAEAGAGEGIGDPDLIAGLCYWFDPDRTLGSSVGVRINHWPNRSIQNLGNDWVTATYPGAATSSDPEVTTINGYKAVKLGSSLNQWTMPLESCLDVATWTIFMVAQDLSTDDATPESLVRTGTFATHRKLIGSPPGKMRFGTTFGSADVVREGGNKTVTQTPSGPFIYTLRKELFTFAYTKLWLNGEWEGVRPWYAGALPGAQQVTLRAAGGSVGDVLFYDRALTETERQSIEAFLSQKFQIPIVQEYSILEPIP